MTLTSRWINVVLEMSDRYQTMGVALADVPTLREQLQDFRGTVTFESFTTGPYVERLNGPMLSNSRNVLRIEEEGVHWTILYTLPHIGQVRREVLWQRDVLIRELRAAEVALRLSKGSQPTARAV